MDPHAACKPGVQAEEVTAGSGMNNAGQLAEDVTAPVKEAASEAVKAAGPDTTKGVLISVGAAAVLAVVTFSFTGNAPTPKQATDAATKLKDLNEF
ncbi:MAG: hypothetical protein FRX49_12375 [Trebouxia sp. A1-2]|nr:MAG: hypothetical protein FRX49_12375 [Trebouxia sp. A1-2]